MFESLAVQELFPTPLWICDLAEQHRARINADLKARIAALIEPRPPIEVGGTWQTDPILHRMPEFAEFAGLVEGAARGAFRFLGISYDSFEITGCWANVNPPGGLNSSHNHPNNYLSGVYYVEVPAGTGQIVFADPRPQAGVIVPTTAAYNKFTGNKITAEAKPGRMFLFPGWLFHSVPVNRGDGDRISIAFNVMFTQYTEKMSPPLWSGTVPLKRRS
ncbi:MAG: TIGR02466 family protein [Dongiaceae bacterium]